MVWNVEPNHLYLHWQELWRTGEMKGEGRKEGAYHKKNDPTRSAPQKRDGNDVGDRKVLGDRLESVLPKNRGKHDRDGGTAIVQTKEATLRPKKGKRRSGKRRT
jgi:hypothetical protein